MPEQQLLLDYAPVDPAEFEPSRALLDQLLTDAKLYTSSASYIELLDFVARLRNFAPFNAMLLQIQKPGLTYAASAADWWERFQRRPKLDARPLLILWPFSPVALVYDVLDTEGKDLPPDVSTFFAAGTIDSKAFASFLPALAKQEIFHAFFDAGDRKAGSIRVLQRFEKQRHTYVIAINRNHSVPTQFTTLAHELGHLYLGHLGADPKRNIPDRRGLTHCEAELEAESVAYLVCKRNGIAPKSESYLADFVKDDMSVDDIHLYQVLRAAGQVETSLGLVAHTLFPNVRRRTRH